MTFTSKLGKNVGTLSAILRQCVRYSCGVQDINSNSSGHSADIFIYNPLIKRKSKLITKERNIISWYCCGPTVYDSAHIGHACCYIQFDIIRRIMEEVFSQNVIFVMGITDIDDKIIKKANDEGVNFKQISQYYEKEFFNDMNLINIMKPTLTARVTDYIPDIVNFTQKIIDKGYGYVTDDGSVNFSVDKYGGYGIFIGDDFTQDSDKSSNRDFVLWKAAKSGEPYWLSPWGKGRPGWHIECSTIASKLLGNHLDFHSGGIDLKFPHHENEETQCCVYHSINSWVTYWLHSGHVYLNQSEKMSKSLKNTISINSFLSKYAADHLRMLCLMVPYRNGIEYSDNVMENSVAVYNKFINFINDCNAYMNGSKPLGMFDESAVFQDLNETREAVLKSFANDFDTSSAVSKMIQFITNTSVAFNNKNDTMETRSYFVVAVARVFVQKFLSVCGCTLNNLGISNSEYDISNLVEASLQLRSEVRKIALNVDRNDPHLGKLKSSLLASCDQFRKNVQNAGIELKDHGNTTSWNLIDNKVRS